MICFYVVFSPYLFVYMSMCYMPHVSSCLQRPETVSDPHGSRVKGSFKLPDMGTRIKLGSRGLAANALKH